MSEYVIKTEREIKSCYDCPFCSANDDLDSEDYRSMYCSYPNIGEFVTDYDACRHPDCPLVELPPHGDLIDRRKLWKDTEGLGEYCYDRDFISLCDAIGDAPTILEASKA